jgi:hypothetical protein
MRDGNENTVASRRVNQLFRGRKYEVGKTAYFLSVNFAARVAGRCLAFHFDFSPSLTC